MLPKVSATVILEPEDRLTKPLFDLLTEENRRAYAIADSVDRGELSEAQGEANTSHSAMSRINQSLLRAGLNISVSVAPDWKITARNRSGATYDLSHASDGERNAVIMAATVLTAPEGALILVDEPDRHLHPSAVVPLVAALAELRNDCVFAIATYEASLPDSDRNATALVVRSCVWTDGTPTAWDLDRIGPGQLLPEEVRSALLGARTKTIFVEGTENSLDSKLFCILFPNADIKPRGGHGDVEKAVAALRRNQEYTRIEAFAIVDGDGREETSRESMDGSGIYPMEPFCVECLYYCEDAIYAVAAQLAPTAGNDAETIVGQIKKSILDRLADNNVAMQLVAQRSWRRISADIVRKAPSWQDIAANDDPKFTIELDSPKEAEFQRYHELLHASDFDGLAHRYPIYRSNALEEVPRLLGLRDREAYENTLLDRVGKDAELAGKLRNRMGHWADDLITSLET